MNKLTSVSASFLLALLILLPYSLRQSMEITIANIVLAFTGVVLFHFGFNPFSCKKDFSVAMGIAMAVTLLTVNVEHILI